MSPVRFLVAPQERVTPSSDSLFYVFSPCFLIMGDQLLLHATRLPPMGASLVFDDEDAYGMSFHG